MCPMQTHKGEAGLEGEQGPASLVEPEKLSSSSDLEEQQAEGDAEEPQDGGRTAWVQVLASHLVLINTWGYQNSFGIFQPYYVATYQRSASDISWVGSLEIFLLFFVGTFSGRAVDAGYFRPCVAAGLFLLVFGVFMASISTEYWHLVLSQGICQGLGNGLLFCPMIALIATYFRRNRAFAISMQATGAATGGMIFPAMAQSLVPRIGLPWTMRAMGLVMLFNAAVVLLLAKPRAAAARHADQKRAPWIEWAAFREPAYALFAVGAFLSIWGVYFAYFYVRQYARDVVLVDDRTSFSLLLVLNGLGVPARIIPALIADRVAGPLNMFIPSVFLAGVTLLCWIAVGESLAGLWVFAAIYGYLAGGVQSLFPASLSSLTSDMSKIGVRIGMVFTIVSFAALSGPPIAGALIRNSTDGGRPDYLYAQIFGGIVMVCGSLFIAGARTARVGLRLVAKI